MENQLSAVAEGTEEAESILEEKSWVLGYSKNN